MLFTKTNNPVQPEELCGASFLPNRLTIPIVRGTLSSRFCYLPNVLVIDVITDDTGNDTDDKRRYYHLLPSWFNAEVQKG